MEELVIHHPVHPFVRRAGVVDIFERLYAEREPVVRYRCRAGIPEVVVVVEIDSYLLARRVIEHLHVIAKRVFITPGEMRDDVFLFIKEIRDTQRFGLITAVIERVIRAERRNAQHQKNKRHA